MMRFFRWLLVIFIIVFIGMVPFIDGYIFEQNYLATIDTFNAEYGYQIKVISYRLGWLQSHATLQVQAKTRGTYSNIIKIEQDIIHGPFLHDSEQHTWQLGQAMILSDIDFPVELKSLLIKQGDSADFHAATRVTLSGDYQSHFSTPSFTLIYPTMVGKLTWSGLQGQSNITMDDMQPIHIISNLNLGALSSQGGQYTLNTRNVIIQSDASRHSLRLWSGTYSVNVPEIMVSDSSSTRYSLNGLNMIINLNIDTNNSVNYDEAITLNNLTVPLITIHPSSFKFSLQHMSGQAMKEFAAQAKKLAQSSNVSQTELVNISKFPIRILTQNTIATQEIMLDSSLGKVIVSGQETWPKDVSRFNTIDDVMNSTMVKMNLQISANLVNAVIKQIYQGVVRNSPATVNMQPTEQSLLDEISDWSSQGRVPVDISYQLKDLVKMHLAQPVFASNVDAFVTQKVIDSGVAAELKAKYAVIYLSVKDNKPATTLQPVVAPPVQPLTPEQVMRKQVDDWIKLGFIKQVGDMYVTLLTYENGELKLNGFKFVYTPIEPVQSVKVSVQPTVPSVQQVVPVVQQPTPALKQIEGTVVLPLPVVKQPAQSTTIMPQPGPAVPPVNRSTPTVIPH